MKKLVPILAISLVLAQAQAAETYRIDPVHSTVGFKIKHLYSKVTGRFADVNGTITGDPAKPEDAQVTVEIKTASIDTGDQKRDEHLRSADFFDVDQFPTMKFVSKKVSRTGEDTAFVTGDLTMRGVTKESILQVTFQGKGKDANGAIRTGWEARTALKRSDFGLTWGKSVEGTQVVSDDVEIELNIEGIEEKSEPTAAPAVATVTPPAPAPAPATAPTPAAEAPAQAALPFVFLTPEQKTAATPKAEPVATVPAPAPAAAPAAPAAPAEAAAPAKPAEVAPPAKDAAPAQQ